MLHSYYLQNSIIIIIDNLLITSLLLQFSSNYYFKLLLQGITFYSTNEFRSQNFDFRPNSKCLITLTIEPIVEQKNQLVFNFHIFQTQINVAFYSFYQHLTKSKINKQQVQRAYNNQQNFICYSPEMRPEKAFNSYRVDQQPQHDHQQLHYGSKDEANEQVTRLKKVIIALIVFILIISGLVIYRQFHNSQAVKNGKFYQNQLLGYELDDFWKMTAKQQEQQQADVQQKIIKKGQHQISRKQLGHNSWTLLHMITGGFPDEMNEVLVKKFNVFLIMFGQMYPCKLCANHFMELLKEAGPFKGTTKLQLMTYLCNIHNRVNQRLGKPVHSCENIVEQWNTCGCSGR